MTEPFNQPVTAVEEQSAIAHYPRWKVFCHNDDATTMEFVVQVLKTIFSLPLQRATAVMLEVHNKGLAFVGAYTREQAEFRIEQAHLLARGAGFPLT